MTVTTGDLHFALDVEPVIDQYVQSGDRSANHVGDKYDSVLALVDDRHVPRTIQEFGVGYRLYKLVFVVDHLKRTRSQSPAGSVLRRNVADHYESIVDDSERR